MGAWFLAIVVTIKALVTPMQILNDVIRRKKEGTVLVGRFLAIAIASQTAIVVSWSTAAAIAWGLVGGV